MKMDTHSCEVDCDDSDAILYSVSVAPKCDGFYLHTNGATVLCPGATVKDNGLVGTTTHTKADESLLNSLSFGDPA